MRRLSVFAALLLTMVMTACGFQLRGEYKLPFQTLHIGFPETTEFYALIKRTVEASSSVKVVTSQKDADASLRILADVPVKKVLSKNSSGQVREYELLRSFGFQLVDKDNRILIPPSQIVLKRDITYSDAVVLSKEAEEALLWRDIQNDLVQQLMRRLATAKLRED